MAQPYIGEIRMFAGNFAPVGWMFCDGQLIPISENDALFNLIGTTYGGDGQETFGLPDLRGRIPMHQGSGFIVGQSAGVESVTLTLNQLSSHSHPMLASMDASDTPNPGNAFSAVNNVVEVFSGDPPGGTMGTPIGPAGSNQPHENLQPFLCVNFIISLFGIFPSQT